MQHPTLRVAAVLSLAKFMCVSAKFCEAHLMLLFKLLETASDPVTRSNIVIALGDIAVCFSNIMDENSDRLYLGLRDADLTVKKNTLMVLTHLILNGMIKVKGQLGEMAKCITDDQVRISDLAKLFFEELASKDNAIYNNLPECGRPLRPRPRSNSLRAQHHLASKPERSRRQRRRVRGHHRTYLQVH
jgi:condensin complex subunit 1